MTTEFEEKLLQNLLDIHSNINNLQKTVNNLNIKMDNMYIELKGDIHELKDKVSNLEQGQAKMNGIIIEIRDDLYTVHQANLETRDIFQRKTGIKF